MPLLSLVLLCLCLAQAQEPVAPPTIHLLERVELQQTPFYWEELTRGSLAVALGATASVQVRYDSAIPYDTGVHRTVVRVRPVATLPGGQVALELRRLDSDGQTVRGSRPVRGALSSGQTATFSLPGRYEMQERNIRVVLSGLVIQ